MAPTGTGRRKSGAFLSNERCVSDLVVIRGVGLQDTAQMRLTEHDYVIEAFATY